MVHIVGILGLCMVHIVGILGLCMVHIVGILGVMYGTYSWHIRCYVWYI